MGEFGPATPIVTRLVDRAGSISLEEAVDLYRAHATRILVHGSAAERRAIVDGRRAAVRIGLEPEYDRARRSAVTAWRHRLPAAEGPWLLVGAAIANAAGALVVHDSLDHEAYDLLVGPWRQALGLMTPVGPGIPVGEAARARR